MRDEVCIKRNLSSTLSILFLLFSLCIAVFGQAGTTSISGIVKDTNGAIISGATVKIINADKGITRDVTTNNDGAFTFPVLQPGNYRIEVTANNFKKYQSDVKAFVDTPVTLSVQLEVGSVTEVVTVGSGVEALVNSSDASVGNTISAQQVVELPTEARSVIGLLSLQPGVTRDGNVAGVRNDQNNITLDGVDINEAQTNDIATPVLRLQAEANHLLGETYLQNKKGSKAVIYLNEAIKLAPIEKAEIHLRLAALYNAAGLKDKAVEEYKMFLQKVPNHAEKSKIEKYIKENSPK